MKTDLKFIDNCLCEMYPYQLLNIWTVLICIYYPSKIEVLKIYFEKQDRLNFIHHSIGSIKGQICDMNADRNRLNSSKLRLFRTSFHQAGSSDTVVPSGPQEGQSSIKRRSNPIIHVSLPET